MAIDTITEVTLATLRHYDKSITPEDISAFMIEYQEKWKDRGCDYKAVLVEGQIDGIAQIIPEKNNGELFENNIKS